MEIKYFSGGKASPKGGDHGSRQFKARNYSQKNNLLEAIAKANGGDLVSQKEENGVVRVKIVLRKQDLKQMLQVVGNANCKRLSSSSSSSTPSSSFEQRLNFLRKKQLLRANLARQSRRSSWSPVLQSIPEEL